MINDQSSCGVFSRMSRYPNVMAHQAFTLEFVAGELPQQVVLRATGRLTAGAGADHPIWAELSAAADGMVLQLDLAGVCRIDAAGIGRLAELSTAVRARGGNVQLVAASERVRTMLRVTGVEPAFDRPTPSARVMPFRNRSLPSLSARSLSSSPSSLKGPRDGCGCAQAAL